MEDKYIVELFINRDEEAIKLTQSKYRRYCYVIANNILHNHEDSQECLNDTWVTAWNTIPPAKPANLGVYVGKITRYKALKRYVYLQAEKRSGNTEATDIDDLSELLSCKTDLEEEAIAKDIVKCINEFLTGISERDRTMFLQRYYYFYPVSDISRYFGVKPNYVRTVLLRTTEKLKKYLRKRGYDFEN